MVRNSNQFERPFDVRTFETFGWSNGPDFGVRISDDHCTKTVKRQWWVCVLLVVPHVIKIDFPIDSMLHRTIINLIDTLKHYAFRTYQL